MFTSQSHSRVFFRVPFRTSKNRWGGNDDMATLKQYQELHTIANSDYKHITTFSAQWFQPKPSTNYKLPGIIFRHTEFYFICRTPTISNTAKLSVDITKLCHAVHVLQNACLLSELLDWSLRGNVLVSLLSIAQAFLSFLLQSPQNNFS